MYIMCPRCVLTQNISIYLSIYIVEYSLYIYICVEITKNIHLYIYVYNVSPMCIIQNIYIYIYIDEYSLYICICDAAARAGHVTCQPKAHGSTNKNKNMFYEHILKKTVPPTYEMICMRTYMCAYISLYICVFICIHTHTHTHSRARALSLSLSLSLSHTHTHTHAHAHTRTHTHSCYQGPLRAAASRGT